MVLLIEMFHVVCFLHVPGWGASDGGHVMCKSLLVRLQSYQVFC